MPLAKVFGPYIIQKAREALNKMVQKKKAPTKAAAKKLGGSGGIKKSKNVTKLGEATSRRMQEKLN